MCVKNDSSNKKIFRILDEFILICSLMGFIEFMKFMKHEFCYAKFTLDKLNKLNKLST